MFSENKWLNHTNLYVLGFLVMVIGLPLSKYMVGMSQFILLGNWLLELDYKAKLKRFWNNKVAVAWVAFFVLHLIAMLWSTDFNYGLVDLKKKLPILILPFVLSSTNFLTKVHFKLILLLFAASVVVATFVCYYVYLGQLRTNTMLEVRRISIFISHIRFGLMMVFSILIFVYFAFISTIKVPVWQKIIAIIFIRWILYFMGIIQSVTANFILGTVVAFISIHYVFFKQTNKKTKLGVSIFFIASIIGSGIYLKNIGYGFIVTNPVVLKKQTFKGNNYMHYPELKQVENGNLVWVNLCEKELRETWNSSWKHSIDYDGKDLLNQPLRTTIIRYLASKNKSKDKLGIQKLKPNEFRAIEHGFTNYKYRKLSGAKRIYEIFWSIHNYLHGGNPSGNTLAQKIEFWKTGTSIFKDNWLYGVGTGDVQLKFDEYYKKSNSILNEDWRLRAHNQYLTIALTFGLFGFIYFIWLLLFTLKQNAKHFLAISLWLILTISMLTEDNLETQPGVTFTMLFIGLFFIAKPRLDEGP